MLSHTKTAMIISLLSLSMMLQGCIIIIDGCHGKSYKAKYQRTDEQSQTLASGQTVDVDTASGSISIRGADTDTCRVTATIQARAETEEEAKTYADQVKIQLQSTAHGLTIRADRPKNDKKHSISISYDIVVPHESHIICKSASGSLKLNNLSGDVTAHTASGSVSSQDLGHGEIHCSSASGNVSLTTGQNIGTCDLHTASGSVKTTDVTAHTLKLKTSSGSVKADRVSCEVLRAHSSSGSVSTKFNETAPPHVDAEATTTSGSVNVTLASNFAGHVDVGTHSGGLNLNRPITVSGNMGKKHLKGQIGEGTGRLIAKTTSGSVTIN